MPHGENLILVLEDDIVTGALMKDIGEEVAYLGEGRLPTEVERIRAIVPGEEKALSIFTDVFDGVPRHLAGILDVDGILAAGRFWSLVAEVLDRYESTHPVTARGLAGDIDLRAGRFKHSCLNRLRYAQHDADGRPRQPGRFAHLCGNDAQPRGTVSGGPPVARRWVEFPASGYHRSHGRLLRGGRRGRCSGLS